MPDYQRLYTILFNAITDAILCLRKGSRDRAEEVLIRAQQETEEIYISAQE